jgi:hypothetical protein
VPNTPPALFKAAECHSEPFRLAFRFGRIRIAFDVTTVFISYKHESTEHGERVLAFAGALRSAGDTYGVSVLLDQYFKQKNPGGPDEGWEIWSENQAAKADFILVVASREYHSGYNLKHAAGTAPGIIPEIFIIRKRISAEGYQPNTVRPVALVPADEPFVPEAISHLHRFGGGDAEMVLAWITGSSAAGAPAGNWLQTPPTIDWRVADCDDIRTAFAKFLIPAAAKRILLIKGESGLGKSMLMAELAAFPSKISGGPLAALLDLKSGVDIHPLLEAFARKLRLRDVYRAAKGLAPLDCLSALFDALEQRAQPAVLLFDTFESGGTYAQWVEQNILPITAVVQWLRVVVAGKEVPDTTRAEAAAWRDVAERQILKKLEWAAWRPLFARLRPELREDKIEDLHKIVHGDHYIMHAILRVSTAA